MLVVVLASLATRMRVRGAACAPRRQTGRDPHLHDTLHTPLAASDRARAVEGQVGAREEPDKLCSAPLLETTDCLQEGENRVRMMTGILTDYEMDEM